MLSQEVFFKLIHTAINDLNQVLPPEDQLKESSAIFGKEGGLDSLNFMSFISMIEEQLAHTHGISVILTTPSLFENNFQHLSSINALATYLSQQDFSSQKPTQTASIKAPSHQSLLTPPTIEKRTLKTMRVIDVLIQGYYWAKLFLLKKLVKKEAFEILLHDALFPKIVLEMGGAKIGKKVRIHRYLTVHASKGSFENLTIGNDVFIGKSVIIDLTDKVTIGSNCCIGMNCHLITHVNLGGSRLAKRYKPEQAPIIMHDHTVLNWSITVLKGTIFEEGVLVLPQSVVSGRLITGMTYIGNPARPITQV